jgi:hypothetical protein
MRVTFERAVQREDRPNPYRPNYAMYSKAPEGYHDEPFEYVWSFQRTLAAGSVTLGDLDSLNNPLQFDPDADFYLRGIAVVVDQVPVSASTTFVNINFGMRLRDAFDRPLDDGFIPLPAYAVNPTSNGPFPSPAGSPVGTPNYPELYCPASSVMYADFQAENT